MIRQFLLVELSKASEKVSEWHQELDAKLAQDATPEQIEAAKSWKGTLKYIVDSFRKSV